MDLYKDEYLISLFESYNWIAALIISAQHNLNSIDQQYLRCDLLYNNKKIYSIIEFKTMLITLFGKLDKHVVMDATYKRTRTIIQHMMNMNDRGGYDRMFAWDIKVDHSRS